MTIDAVACHLFNGISTPDTHKRDEVWVDPLSVELCLGCTEPECHGAKGAESGGYCGPPRCAYEAAVMARRNVTAGVTKRRRVKIPPPRPDGKLVWWECEVG